MSSTGGSQTETRPPAREAAKLYVIPGSHACRTGMLLLEHKSIPYTTVELPTGLHPQLVRLHGFSGSRHPTRMIDGRPTRMSAMMDRFGTVPALRMGEARVQRNMEIARYLEQIEPEPPLFPDDPELRAKVQEAAEWGDEPLQMAARRIVLAAGARDPGELHARGEDGRLGALLAGNGVQRRVMAQVATGVFGVRGTKDAELIEELPPMLDRIDTLVAEGVLNGEQLYLADLVIAPCLALLDYRLDLREELRARPGFALVERLLPEPA
jgi:glutathione S-transferase